MNNFEWCRKKKYEVEIELGCYLLTNDMTLIDGFFEKEFNGKKYAIKNGNNILEQNEWTTSPDKPYIITGTYGEKWPIGLEELNSYDVKPFNIGIIPIKIATKDSDEQEFLIAYKVDEKVTNTMVIPENAFMGDGIDTHRILLVNSPLSQIPHNGGDYIIAKHIPGKPEYMDYPEEQRNSRYAANLYKPRVINGSIMESTYDHALTQNEIIEKNKNKVYSLKI